MSDIDYNRIYKKPPLPPEIKKAIDDNSLVVFIGAGVSQIVGCKGWGQLSTELINLCFDTEKSNGKGNCINFKEKNTLYQMHNNKKVITMCYHILKKNGYEELFYDKLDTAFEPDRNKRKMYDIYPHIYNLRGINVTTNADTVFEENHYRPENVLFNLEEFNPNDINRDKLYKIHGSKQDRESLVFTVPEYIKRYRNPQFRDFLNEIFCSKKYTVLFLGYGLSEFELLDFIITKFDDNEDIELRHFILDSFFNGEENILNFEQDYYNDMGIRVIAYEKDEIGYAQLFNVLKNWQSDVELTSTYTEDSFDEIDTFLGLK